MQLSVGKGFFHHGKPRTARYRKWLLLAAAGDLTALVTVQVPEHETDYSVRDVRAALATRRYAPPSRRQRNSACCRSRLATWPDLKSRACCPGRALVLSDVQGEGPDDCQGASNAASMPRADRRLSGGPQAR